MSSEAELEGLRAAAQAIEHDLTWLVIDHAQGGMNMTVYPVEIWDELNMTVAIVPGHSDADANKVAAYIAQASPLNILSLLDSLQSTRAQLERAEAVVEAAKEFRRAYELTEAGWGWELTRTGQRSAWDCRLELFSQLKINQSSNSERAAAREDSNG